MTMALHDLADPIVEPRFVAREQPPESPTESPASLFREGEWEQFQEEDNAAGRNIGKILATLFLYTMFIMSIVVWWTIRTLG